MRIIVGEIAPKTNRKCKVTGKTFGPGKQQKRGFVVQKIDGGKTSTTFVATREAARKIKEQMSANG